MTNRRTWQPVLEAIDAWHKAGLKAPFWLRDDDATGPTPALHRLIALTAHYEIPLTLAVIPAASGSDLAEKVVQNAHVTPVVHGWTHRNHAPKREKKQEFGLHRPIGVMQQELSLALSRMEKLFARRLEPMFVPPWNRIAPQLVHTLSDLGYAAISTFGPAPEQHDHPKVPTINTHIDIIDFRGTRRCRDHGLLAGSIAATLSDSLGQGRYPVGILSHHLVHDDPAFEFLEALFSVAGGEQWLSPGELIERRTGLVR